MDIVREEFSLKMAPNFRGCQSYIFDVVKVVSSQFPRTQEAKKREIKKVRTVSSTLWASWTTQYWRYGTKI